MIHASVSKRTLGRGYVVSAGVVLSLVLLAHAIAALQSNPVAAFVAAAGLVPALGLVGATYWLPASGLSSDGIWRVAQWSGLGIALLTLVDVGVLAVVRPLSSITPVLLATAVAVGGATGVLVGALLELRTEIRRLERGNAVLGRVLQHNLRNDLTVVLGHLGQLERAVAETPVDRCEATERVRRLGDKVDDIVTTAEKARQVDVALSARNRPRQPVDVVPPLRERLQAVERAYPDATITTDLPTQARVEADWFVKTVIDNLVENVVVHAESDPELRVTVERRNGTVVVRFVDDCPPIPENELAVFTGAVETSLAHSTGVGLWLVRLVMESYGGDVSHEFVDGGGNAIELRFRAVGSSSPRSLLNRARALLPR